MSKTKSNSSDEGIRADEIIFEDTFVPGDDNSATDLNRCKDAARQGTGKRLTAASVQLGSISNDRIDATHAFGIFAGASLAVTDASSGEAVWSYAKIDGDRKAATSTSATEESVQERLLRLKLELQEVASDAAALDQAAGGGNGKGTVWGALEREARQLTSVADVVGSRKAKATAPVEDSTSCNNATDSNGNGRSRGVVGDADGDGDGDAVSAVRLEQRLAALERCIGCGSASGSAAASAKSGAASMGSLVSALEKLERRVASMDTATLDAVKAKVATVKRELDAFQQHAQPSAGIAATKSGGGAGAATPLKVVEAACIIEELYARSLRVDEVVDALPSIILRLRSLHTLHSQATTYAARVKSLEDTVGALSAEAAANRELISVLQKGVTENEAVFEGNVRQLEGRMEALANVNKQ